MLFPFMLTQCIEKLSKRKIQVIQGMDELDKESSKGKTGK